ncbi:MAG: insulinase family protein [Verrucomicrobia bacterium]|nr:insulinase family protein [Verrucomicrobiota bacterium]
MVLSSHFLNAVGERYGDFIVTKFLPIPEINGILREIEHVPTGAQVMHIASDDPENLFCLSFETLPSSSNGVAHILEHTVLCGSRKFPVKDPFFAMSRRSLNTFMNALTGSDFTCYPAASQVEKDFYNLLDVYIDAVFHPQLSRMSFLQEGHRLEFLDPKDSKSPLQIKGIVFNEMKGSLASADNRMWHALMAELVPDLTYAYNSGGDPQEIPSLSYAELIAFHETYYHPSRCLYFFYGNLPLKKHLDVLAEKALHNVPKAPPLPEIPLQRRFSSPKRKEMRYPIAEGEETASRTLICFGFLTTPLKNQEEVLALSILDSVLMETDASPLKKELIESKLCVQAESYMDSEMTEVPYAIVCKGCDGKNVDLLEKKLREVLTHIVRTGIPEHLIDAALHQLEFSRLEITGDHSPYGLTLFMRSALAKQHGASPENALQVQTLFEKLLLKVKDPTYLTDLIQTHLLDNPHAVRLVMHPDPHLSSEELKEETALLEKRHRELTNEERVQIQRQTEDLAAYQKQTEEQSLDCLPKVTLDDVHPLARDFPLKKHAANGLTVYHHDCFTNHILYANLLFDLPDIPEEDLPYVQLLCNLLTEVGSGERSYEENLDYIHAHTGGIGASCALHLQVSDPKTGRPSFTLRGKALYRKADKLFALMRDTLLKPRFDEKKRIEGWIQQLRSAQQNRLSRNALRYASHLAICGFSSAAYVSECWNGLTYYKQIEALSKDIGPLVDKLLDLKERLFTFHEPHLVLTCDKAFFEELEAKEFFQIGDLPKGRPFTPWNIAYPPHTVLSQGRTIASQVAFNVAAFKTISYIHPHAPALTVASLLLDNKILHREIRERGGAYGCGATFSTQMGYFSLHSYRDPHIAKTFQTFWDAIDQLSTKPVSDQDLEEAKLGIIQQIDVPISPGSRGATAYSWLRDGRHREMRQSFRDRLLSLTPEAVQHVIMAELKPKRESAIEIAFAGKDLLEKEGGNLPIFTI